MRAVKLILAFAGILLVVLIASGLYMVIRRAVSPEIEEIPSVAVEVVTAEIQPFFERFSYTGTVLGEHSSTVAAQVGATVEKLLVDEGDKVEAGQVLAVLDDTVYSSQATIARASHEIARLNLASAESLRPEQISQAEANYRAAQLAAETAYKNYQRNKNLFDEGVVSRAAYEGAELNYESAKAQFTAAKENLRIAKTGAREEDKKSLQLAVDLAAAQLRLAQNDLSNASITAPYSGEISRRMFDIGDYVERGEPVFELVSAEGLRVELFVPSDKIGLFKAGQAAQASITGSASPVDATVTRVVSSADPRTRLFRVELALPPGTAARPQEFAEVTLAWKVGEGTVVLPVKAILAPASDEPYVFTVVNGEARRVPVKLGLRNGICVQVLEPLRGGEAVIVNGQAYVADGSPVEVSASSETCEVPVSENAVTPE